jgi:hypothetical protein
MCDPRVWFEPHTQRSPGREEGRKQDRITQLGTAEGGPRDTRLWSWRQDDRRCEAEKEQDRQANAFLRAINDEQRRAIITHIAHKVWDIRWALMEEDMHCMHREEDMDCMHLTGPEDEHSGTCRMLSDERRRGVEKMERIKVIKKEISRDNLTPRELRKLWEETNLAAREAMIFQGSEGQMRMTSPSLLKWTWGETLWGGVAGLRDGDGTYRLTRGEILECQCRRISGEELDKALQT